MTIFKRSMTLLTTALVAGGIAASSAPAAEAYLHVADCRAALLGANGDNDIHTYRIFNQYDNWSWGDGASWRYSDTYVAVATNFWGGNTPIYGGSYCRGNDGSIRDNAMTGVA